MLLEEDRIDPNEPKGDGTTPLISVCQEGLEKIATLLLESPKVEKGRSNGQGISPLFAACLRGASCIVERLLPLPEADPNLTRNDGCTPLWAAAHKGHVEVVRVLLSSDHDVKVKKKWINGNTAAEQALVNGHKDIADLIAEYSKSRRKTRNALKEAAQGDSDAPSQ